MRVYNIYKYNSYNTHDLKNNSNHFLSLFYFKKFFNKGYIRDIDIYITDSRFFEFSVVAGFLPGRLIAI